MINIKNFFDEIKNSDTYKRVDENHILDLYLGLDALHRYTMFLVSKSEPQLLFSSQIINVQIGIRSDKRWVISFSLIDNNYEDIFLHFCTDIVESSRCIENKENGALFIRNRYLKWQSMLSKYKGEILSEAEIKGLIGELYFLKNYLIPKYNQEVAINAWIGPEKSHQDFVCEDLWYEIKSTVSGAERVGISSIEQLDMDIEGELVIICLDKTSNLDSNKISLNSIYDDVYRILKSDYLKQRLGEILLNLGYYKRNEYDEPIFRFSKMDRYKVSNDFPCLRKNNLSHGIIDAKYGLSISYIKRYLKG